MDVPQPSSPEPNRLNDVSNLTTQPAPDYGTLGPNSDVNSTPGPAPDRGSRAAAVLAATVGVILALIVANLGSAHAAWSRVFSPPASKVASSTASDVDTGRIEELKPQKQAEALLELAVAHSENANDQISSRIDRWQGKLKWDSQMATLTTAALSSNDMRVRESGIEVELAAYGLAKNSASLDYVLKAADSPNHSEKVWGLWALGLMGNRGVESGRVVEVLTTHLKDSDEDSRHWAVDGLALVGTSETIPLLLGTMHDDASPRVREEAACGLAQSGMFTHAQRVTAIPQLLNFTDDPSLDAQTHGWAFQALRDITGQHLPNESSAWRSWYQYQR